jgi:hypothetical protein
MNSGNKRKKIEELNSDGYELFVPMSSQRIILVVKRHKFVVPPLKSSRISTKCE